MFYALTLQAELRGIVYYLSCWKAQLHKSALQQTPVCMTYYMKGGLVTYMLRS